MSVEYRVDVAWHDKGKGLEHMLNERAGEGWRLHTISRLAGDRNYQLVWERKVRAERPDSERVPAPPGTWFPTAGNE